MKGKIGAIGAVVLLAALITAMPAHAIVIEDVVTHHPLVAFVSSWGSDSNQLRANAPAPLKEDNSLLPPELHNLTAANTNVAPDNMTVEVVPIHLPKLPASVVFMLYLVGAMVFYTLLVLIAQPGPAEYY